MVGLKGNPPALQAEGSIKGAGKAQHQKGINASMVSQQASEASENPPKQSTIEVAARLADPTKPIASNHFDATSDNGKVWHCYLFEYARHILGIPFWHDILTPVRDAAFALGEPERAAMEYALKTWLLVHFDVTSVADLADDETAAKIGLDWVGESEFFDEFRAAITRVAKPRVSGDFWQFAVDRASNDFSKGDHPARVKAIRDKLGLRSPFQVLALQIMHECALCYSAAGGVFPLPQSKLAQTINAIAAGKAQFKGRTTDQPTISRFINDLTRHGFLAMTAKSEAHNLAAEYQFKI